MIQMAAAGIGAKMIDAMAGQNRDAVQFRRQRILNQENNKFNAEESAKQRSAAAAAQAEQQRYNSEQAQVSRLRQAGLNPALLYGGATSSGGISSTSAASASPSSYSPSGTQLDVAGGLALGSQMDLQSAQVENTRTNTASQAEDVVSKQTTNKYIDAKSHLENWKLLEEVNNLIKSGQVMDKDLEWYDRMKSLLMRQIESQIAESQANAAYTSGAKTANTNADTVYKGELSRTEGTIRDLNRAKTKTEETQQDVNRENVNSQRTHQALEQMQTKVQDITEQELQRKYGLDNSETKGFYKFCDKFGIPRAFAKGLMNIYGQFTNETGKGLGEFFSGNNWFNWWNQKQRNNTDKEINSDRIESNEKISRERNESDERMNDKRVEAENYRTNEWSYKHDNSGLDDLVDRGNSKGYLDDLVDRGKPSGELHDLVDRSPVARSTPSLDNFNKEYQKRIYPMLSDIQKSNLSQVFENYKSWSKDKQDAFRREMYYAQTSKEITNIINKYLK